MGTRDLYFHFTEMGAAPRFEKENTKMGAFHFYKNRGKIIFSVNLKAPIFVK